MNTLLVGGGIGNCIISQPRGFSYTSSDLDMYRVFCVVDEMSIYPITGLFGSVVQVILPINSDGVGANMLPMFSALLLMFAK
jgi:hypothetical protein